MSPIVTRNQGRNPAARTVCRGSRRLAALASSASPPATPAALATSFEDVRQLARTLERREESVPWLLAMLERGDLPALARANATRALVLAVASFGAGRIDELVDAVQARHRASAAVLEGLAALGTLGLPGLERILGASEGPDFERALAFVLLVDRAELELHIASACGRETSRGFLVLLLVAGFTPGQRAAIAARIGTSEQRSGR